MTWLAPAGAGAAALTERRNHQLARSRGAPEQGLFRRGALAESRRTAPVPALRPNTRDAPEEPPFHAARGGDLGGQHGGFPNLDPIFHNAFSNFSGQPFDIGLYRAAAPPGAQLFKHPGIVRVFCNIHPTMSAIIAVLPTPWYADHSGDRQIHASPNVPPGDYQLHIFHERALPENLRFLEHRSRCRKAA